MQVEADDLVVTLEGIVEKFGEEIAPYAVGLCQHLTSAFYRTLQVRHIPSLENSRVWLCSQAMHSVCHISVVTVTPSQICRQVLW